MMAFVGKSARGRLRPFFCRRCWEDPFHRPQDVRLRRAQNVAFCSGTVARRHYGSNEPLKLKLQLQANPDYVDTRAAPADFDPSWAVVYPDVVTESESDWIVETAQSKLKRQRYNEGHWDDVIVKYKETELVDLDGDKFEPWNTFRTALLRIRNLLEEAHFSSAQVSWLPVHAIDLHAQGELRAHVDSIRFSGDLVAGLSLQSTSIMRLKKSKGNDDEATSEATLNPPQENDQEYVDLLLPPLSLYVLSGPGRYDYTHEILPSGAVFGVNQTRVERDHRISIIFRDTKPS